MHIAQICTVPVLAAFLLFYFSFLPLFSLSSTVTSSVLISIELPFHLFQLISLITQFSYLYIHTLAMYNMSIIY